MRKPKGKLGMCASCSIVTYLENKRVERERKTDVSCVVT